MKNKTFLLLALAATTGCAADTSTTVTPVNHNPILFVHGYGRTSSDWNFMITQFKAAGWTDAELYTIDYGVLQSNASIADDIRAKVDAILAGTGAVKVDIVSHSMGSLASRYYIRNLGGDSKVDAWASLGGPNHGTSTANDCGLTPCLEMRVGSTFLAALNAGDETPGTVRYATWWTASDQTVLPTSSVLLTGASNTQTAAMGHLNLVTDLTIYTQLKAFIAP